MLRAIIKKAVKIFLPDRIHRFLREPPANHSQKSSTWPPFGWVDFGNLLQIKPVSAVWGFDRGQPIDRYYVENFLARHAEAIRGRVLEVGDDSYARRFGGDRISVCDVLHVQEGNPRATIVGDLTHAENIPSDTFDCFILTQTLHLIYDVGQALKSIYRILKPGGVLLLTCPGITRISQDEWAGSWYWGFTSNSIQRLTNEYFPADHVIVEAHGNVLAAVSFLYGLAAEELDRKELDYRDPDFEVILTIKAIKPKQGRALPVVSK